MLIHPNVAGKFYPSDPKLLRSEILKMLGEAGEQAKLPLPKAIIAPHAGYIYSGPIAAAAYACLTQAQHEINQVVLLAPAHRFPVPSIATTTADFYLTPLGKVAIDQATITGVLSPTLSVIEEAFNFEHALEVHLPFLQLTLGEFKLIPLLVGAATVTVVAQLLAQLWHGRETLIVVSSDLSHYHPYRLAQTLDQRTRDAIIQLNPDGVTAEAACGATAIRGLLKIAATKNLQPLAIDLRNSGDTAGSKDSVVGYGAFHFRRLSDKSL